MGTPLGPKYIPYTYMDPLGLFPLVRPCIAYARVKVHALEGP